MSVKQITAFFNLIGLSMTSSLRDRVAPFKIAPCDFDIL